MGGGVLLSLTPRGRVASTYLQRKAWQQWRENALSGSSGH